jgi:hypothetical protein
MLLPIKKNNLFISKKNILKNDETYAKNRLKAFYKKNLKNFVLYFFYNKNPFI